MHPVTRGDMWDVGRSWSWASSTYTVLVLLTMSTIKNMRSKSFTGNTWFTSFTGKRCEAKFGE